MTNPQYIYSDHVIHSITDPQIELLAQSTTTYLRSYRSNFADVIAFMVAEYRVLMAVAAVATSSGGSGRDSAEFGGDGTKFDGGDGVVFNSCLAVGVATEPYAKHGWVRPDIFSIIKLYFYKKKFNFLSSNIKLNTKINEKKKP